MCLLATQVFGKKPALDRFHLSRSDAHIFPKKWGYDALSWAAANYLATNFVHIPMDGAVVRLCLSCQVNALSLPSAKHAVLNPRHLDSGFFFMGNVGSKAGRVSKVVHIVTIPDVTHLTVTGVDQLLDLQQALIHFLVTIIALALCTVTIFFFWGVVCFYSNFL